MPKCLLIIIIILVASRELHLGTLGHGMEEGITPWSREVNLFTWAHGMEESGITPTLRIRFPGKHNNSIVCAA